MTIDTQNLLDAATGAKEFASVGVVTHPHTAKAHINGLADAVATCCGEIDAQAAEIEHLERELAVATDLARQRLVHLYMPTDKPSTWPMSAAQFETAAEYIAMELAERDGHEGDDKHRLIWEGSPPEPWGEVWQRYIPDAQSLLSAGIAGIQDEERRGLAADAARAALSGEGK